MNFVALPAWAVLAGALAIAAALALLQRLRRRRRVLQLPAAMLWRQAVQQAPARVLGGRFRHWPAYLLALLVALLLWLGVAQPRLTPVADARLQLFYLDASAAMQPGDRFARARRALLADAAAVAPVHRVVYLGDGAGSVLLEPGEPLALLARRLQGVAPMAAPSGFASWLAGVPARAGAAPVTLHHYGPALAALRPPAGVELVQGAVAAVVPGNRGIVALGASPAASGAWDRADVALETAAAAGPPPDLAALRFTRAGRAFVPVVRTLAPGRFLLPDLPADGSELVVTLGQGDGFPADDRAALRLPARPRIKVALAPGVPAAIAAVVRADPALQASDAAGAEVAVGLAGDGFAPELPALRLADPAQQADTFVFAGPDTATPDELAQRLDALGLGQRDASALAEHLHRPVTLGLRPAPRRALSVWRTLFDPQAGFARARALPLFVSQSLRWLAAPQGWVPYAQAGTRLLDQSAVYGPVQDPVLAAHGLGDGLYLRAAGSQRVGGRELSVSLIDRGQTLAAAAPVPAARASRPMSAAALPDLLYPVLMLLAGLLLAVEGWLYLRGRMP